MMIRNEKGFSLVELMVTMVVFVLVIAASSQVFTALLTQFKQQSRIGVSNIEGMIGLDILRRDLAGAGFGLPQSLNGTAYQEAIAETGQTFWTDSDLNDGPDDNPARGTDPAGTSNPPAAFRSINNAGIHNADPADGSINVKIPNTFADVLAIKSANVAFDDGAQKWTYVSNRGAWSTIKSWGSGSNENLAAGDRVISVNPDSSSKTTVLQKDASGNFSFRWGSIGSIPAGMQPQTNSYLNYVVYGIDSNNDPRMPFNRADYYVKRPASVPSRCAPHTGVLYKAVLNQNVSSGVLHTELPIIDCVIDFQVDFLLDTTGTPDGIADWPPDDGTLLNNYTARDVRDRLKEVYVYIVAQEGQKDLNYDFDQGKSSGEEGFVKVNEYYGNNSRTLTLVDLRNVYSCAPPPADCPYKYYRWKVYTIAVQPNNLR